MRLNVFWLAAFLTGLSLHPAQANQDIERADEILRLVERSCLSGGETTFGAELNANLSGLKSILKKGLSAELQGDAFKREVRGALDFVDEELRKGENNQIRDCMGPFRDKLIELLLSRTPKFVDLGIDFVFLDPSSQFYANDAITVGTLFAQWPDERNWARQNNNLFAEMIPMIPRGSPPFKAWITRKKKTGTQANFIAEVSETPICLVRAPDDPPFDPSARLKCNEGAKCKRMVRDPGWLVFCEGFEHSALTPIKTPLLWPLRFISRAHAQDNQVGTRWSVPSLDVLEQRQRDNQLVGTGFTQFRIASTTRVPDKVDAFYYDILINGQNVRFDGLRPQLLSSPISVDRKIKFDFGLENLNFSGMVGGCDEITARLQFLSKGEPVGEILELNRFYVALRDADPKAVMAGDLTFEWTGKYRRPEPSYDHEVFVQSIFVSSLDNREEVAKARSDITQLLKKANDTIHTSHRERPVTFVIRPPLSKPQDTSEKKGFGLAAAIVEPTGQIRFTFEKADAFALRNHLTQLGYSRFLIDPGSFVYTVNKDDPNPPDICSEL